MSTPVFPKRGEVWYVSLPNKPGDPHQPRPAIVVSPNGRNQGCNDVIVVPTTSANIQPHPDLHVSIPQGQGGLPKDSIARCEQIATLEKRLLTQGPLGSTVHTSYMWRIVRAIGRAVGDTAV
jgi:mRNA interferase MazF